MSGPAFAQTCDDLATQQMKEDCWWRWHQRNNRYAFTPSPPATSNPLAGEFCNTSYSVQKDKETCWRQLGEVQRICDNNAVDKINTVERQSCWQLWYEEYSYNTAIFIPAPPYVFSVQSTPTPVATYRYTPEPATPHPSTQISQTVRPRTSGRQCTVSPYSHSPTPTKRHKTCTWHKAQGHSRSEFYAYYGGGFYDSHDRDKDCIPCENLR